MIIEPSPRSYLQDAGVLGPVYGQPFTQARDPGGGITPALLARLTEAVRSWENYMLAGKGHAQSAEWEHALRAFQSAHDVSKEPVLQPYLSHYGELALGELGKTNRRFGRYDQAKVILESVLQAIGPSPERIELSGELGVVYRHLDDFVKAKEALEDQLSTARAQQSQAETQQDTSASLHYLSAMCRAFGNLGMVNYQQFLESGVQILLDLAIQQLNERTKPSWLRSMPFLSI